MPRYLLLKHYAGSGAPMPEWTAEEFRAHIAFQHALVAELTATGELVDAQGLAAPEAAKLVTYGGPDADPVVTDGPFPETKEFVAGWLVVDTDTEERAYAIAAKESSAPGPKGEPIYEQIELREILGAPSVD